MAPPPPPRSDVTVYYDPASAASFRVFTALNEKQVSYEAKPVDPAHDEQLQAWFLELSDSARLPVLRHKDRHVVGDVSTIIEHIDENFGRSGQIYPRGKSGEEARELTRKIEAVPIDLLHEGVACFWPEGVTTKLASPLASKESRVRRRDSLIRLPAMLRRHRLEEESRAAEQNLELLRDRDRVVGLLELVESALDNAEGVLGADDRVGVWLCGPTYTAADAAFAALLLKLDMLGLDSLWKGAERPNIAVYQEMAYRRPSFLKATDWKEHLGKTESISATRVAVDGPEADSRNGTNGECNGNGNGVTDGGEGDDDGLAAARVGLGAVLVIGGIYAARKLILKK